MNGPGAIVALSCESGSSTHRPFTFFCMRVRHRMSRSFAIIALALLPLVVDACASSGARSTEISTPVKALPPDAAPPPDVAAPMTPFAKAFFDVDMRARAIVFRNECMPTVQRLRASGVFGAVAAAPKLVFCDRTPDGVPIGGVFDVDSTYTHARRLTLIRLDGARPRYMEPFDTARVAAQAKIARDVMKEVTPAWNKLGRLFTVVPLVQNGTLECWVIPWPSKARSAIIGGDIAFTRIADGRLQRLVDRSASWKTVTVAPTGPVLLPSSEADVAAVADLVVARGLSDFGRDVTVTTGTTHSAFVAGPDPITGARLTWEHRPVTR